jgi:cholesterol transport system auxiliary component
MKPPAYRTYGALPFPKKSNRSRILALLLSAVLLLAGCTAILAPGPPPVRLRMAPSMPERLEGTALNKQLTVAEPLAGREIDTDGIALVFYGREVRYLAGARWTGTAPFLVQRFLIEALEAANVLRGVSDESAGTAADARLLTDIRQFGLEYSSEDATPTAVFDASFRLLNLHDGKILGTRAVKAQVPATGRDNAALARAVEIAVSKALAEIPPWIAGQMRAPR